MYIIFSGQIDFSMLICLPQIENSNKKTRNNFMKWIETFIFCVKMRKLTVTSWDDSPRMKWIYTFINTKRKSHSNLKRQYMTFFPSQSQPQWLCKYLLLAMWIILVLSTAFAGQMVSMVIKFKCVSFFRWKLYEVTKSRIVCVSRTISRQENMFEKQNVRLYLLPRRWNDRMSTRLQFFPQANCCTQIKFKFFVTL